MERPKRESTHYNLLADAPKFAKEEMKIKHGYDFAVFLNVHHMKPPVKKQNEKGEKTADAPPLIPWEILDIIMSHFKCSVLDVLNARQREINFVDVKNLHSNEKLARQVLINAWPSIGERDKGYVYHDWMDMSSYKNGRLVLSVEQRVKGKDVPTGYSLIWTMVVSMDRVPVPENRVSLINIPQRAISIRTNAHNLKDHLQLSQDRIDEMARFRLRGMIVEGGKKLRFLSSGNSVDFHLGFDVVISTPYVMGRQVEAHSGYKVGDTVRLEQCYKIYKHFAVGKVGVIRDIRMYTFAVYFVELIDTDGELAKLVVKAHHKDRGMRKEQQRHHMACQWFHLKKVEGGEGSSGGAKAGGGL
jgi:hypothetical protein